MVIFYIVAYGLVHKRNVYEDFIKGAKDGFQTVIQIMPTLVGLMVAVGVLRASGFLEAVGKIFGGLAEKIGFPSELVPLVFVKMFSSSAATGLVLDIFKTHEAGFPDRNDHFYYDELYRDYFLYHECLFFSGKGNEDEAYFKRRAVCHIGGNYCQRGFGRYGFLI